jgi:hypothetical protein
METIMFRIGTHEIIHSYTPYSKSLYKAAIKDARDAA